ncbi:hypothetical protein BDF22DRAFT_740533 [Syncephalis plumigaleata]|nr:hypothetical protein BDF22DRAFT_740533 [Syncephalis plumigaleata]
MSSDDADSTCAPSRGFAQVRAHYLARQNLMLERELGHARNTAHALREIVRFQEDRLRETDLLNRNLRERIRTLELSISRELADIQQKRHFGLSNYSRKRLMQSGGHSRRGSDTSTSDTLPRRQREDKPLTLSSFRLKDDREDEDIVKQSPPKPRPSVSLWQVASPEPPATLDDNVLNSPTLVSPNISLIEQDAQNIARAMSPTTTNTATSIDSALELDATSTMTYDNITRIESSSNTTKIAVPTTNEQSQSTSPSAIRRDLSSIWCDLRAERSIAIPTEDEGYNSGHSKEGVPLMSNLNAMTSTADTMDNTMTSTELSTASASSSIPLADSLS